MRHIKIKGELIDKDKRKMVKVTVLEQIHFKDEFGDTKPYGNMMYHKDFCFGNVRMVSHNPLVGTSKMDDVDPRSYLGATFNFYVLQKPDLKGTKAASTEVTLEQWQDIKDAVIAYNHVHS